MGYNNVDVMVSGPNKPSSTYKTKILKGNQSFASQVTEANMKYVIKYDFDLGGESVTIPKNCILEFDGGSLNNGTVICTNTSIVGNKDGDVIFSGSLIDKRLDTLREDIDNLQENTDNLQEEVNQLKEDLGPNGSVNQKIEAAKDEIIDDASEGYNTLKKLEDKILAEQQRASEAENNRYTKSETYNKTQLDNMITTPEINYFNYDTYADMLAETEHPAGAIYRVANYDGTQAVTNKYAEYSWDGTQYKLMAVRDYGIDDEPTAGSDRLVKSGGVQNEFALGAVYDVSAKNPTAGSNNDGKFESLSALLSDANLNTLIPIAVRKGGMSIKFVQSSDNKYVQFRLMSTAWSNVVDNWDKCISEMGISGIFEHTFVFPATDSTYKSYYANYKFIKGHHYLVHIDYPDNVSVETYTSVRSSNGTALQNNIGIGTTTRDIHFTCNVDGGEMWYMTVQPEHDTSFSFNARITDLDILSLMALKDKIDNIDINTSNIVNSAVTEEKIADGAITTPKIANSAVTSGKASFTVLPNVVISISVTPDINTQYGYISFGTTSQAMYIATVKGRILINESSYKTDGEYRAYFKDGTTNTASSIIFIYIDTIEKKFVPRGQDKAFNDTQSRYILLGSIACNYTEDGSYIANSFKRASFPFDFTVNGYKITQSEQIADNIVSTAKIVDGAVTETKMNKEVLYKFGVETEKTTSFTAGQSYPWYYILSGINIKIGDSIEWSVETDDDSDDYWMATRDANNQTIQTSSIDKGSRSGVFVVTAAANKFALGIRQMSSYTGNYKIKVRKVESNIVDLEKRVGLLEQQTPTGTSILELNPENEVLPILKNFKHRMKDAGFVDQVEQFVLLQLTDQHGDKTRMNRAMQFASRYSSYIDCVIHTGDLVYDNWANGVGWFADIQNKENILQVIGNHDVSVKAGSDGKIYTDPNDLSQYAETNAHVALNKTTHAVLGYKNSDNEMVWVNYTDIYGRYIAPYVSNWGVIQPSNAATQGLNYYYKDYTDQGIRLIVLDCMEYDNAQNTWLVNVLADAKTNSYGIIIAEHYPIQLDGFEYCAFTSSGRNDVLDFYQSEGNASTLEYAQLAVDNFMNAGGEFICWLAGHTHKDFCGTLKNYPKQAMIISDITGLNHIAWGDAIRTVGTKTEDCFSVIAIDRYKKIVHLYRVGNQWDRYGRHKVSMAFDYRAAKMIYSS